MKKVYRYECTMTGEQFKTTAEAKNPGDLMTVSSFYDMHPEKDDRPADVKARMKELDEKQKADRERLKSLGMST